MRAAALCVLVAVLLVGGASALIPGEVVLRHNASNPCVQAWALMINRTYPGWEYSASAALLVPIPTLCSARCHRQVPL